MGRKTNQQRLKEFKQFLSEPVGDKYIKDHFSVYSGRRMEIFKRWYGETGSEGEVFPSQGLLNTPFDNLEYLGKTLMGEDELWQVLKLRHYLLSVLNHPVRLANLKLKERQAFVPPPKVESHVMDNAQGIDLALSVGDLGAIITGTDGDRIGRRDLLSKGPYVKLGKHARVPFVGGAMPDIFGAPAALATAAACQALVCVPRNGIFSDSNRQVELVKATYEWMELEPILNDRKDRRELLEIWRRQLMGVVEPEFELGLKRAEALHNAGIRAFRVYSPEPGKDAEKLIKKLVSLYGNEVEVFAGQVASLQQGLRFEAAGASGLYIGIGGGGRCITALRSGSVIDWPRLLWQMRGTVKIPVIVEGGGSDHVGVSLLLGASGIGVSRIAGGGTIESPGGLMYLVDRNGIWFKPYGGEASARTKFVDKIMLPLGIPAFVEGETTKAVKSYIPYVKPTLAASLYFLLEDVILSMVFRGVTSITDLQAINPSPLRQISLDGMERQRAH